MNRIINVARMQLINRGTYFGVPVIILIATILISLAIFALIPVDQPIYGGGAQAPLWYFLALGIYSLTLTFPFSQGLSISRRTFFLGTVGLFVVTSLAWAVLYFLLALIERATNGWGLNGYMFDMPWITGGGWLQTIAFFWACTMFLFFVGLWSATIYKRWQVPGLLVAGIAAALILLGVAAYVSFTNTWAEFGAWFVTQTALGIAGWLGLLVVLLGFGAYLTLRRATP
ncbi:hypothetical protein LWF01_03765 [Saxibacter everestensis]|uniref:ABC transporter permease n=1 Tax=Saxibacter everestensis TaxID=2909229 RepID=A0ABY8QWV5_9MICO|nr:hypothetical protein LWF01_03765 [Brevibacteriaceae bacterium ZFBP1038]